MTISTANDHQADDVTHLLSMLEWHVQLGFSDMLGDEAYGYLKPVQQQTPPSSRQAMANLSGQAATNRDDELKSDRPNSIKKAELLAENTHSFDDLKKAILDFKECDLVDTAGHCFIGDGLYQNPPLMIILPYPDYDEDRQGIMNNGKRGAFIKAMLQTIDMQFNDIFTGFCVFWRPPGERSLTQNEIRITAPFFRQLVHLVNPDCLMIFDQKIAIDFVPDLCQTDMDEAVPRKSGAIIPGFYDLSLLAYESEKNKNEQTQAKRKIPCFIAHKVEYYLKNPTSKAHLWPALWRIKNNMILKGEDVG